MKKIMTLVLSLCLLVFSTTVALAFDRETVYEGADITKVERIAIAQPFYTPASDTSPTKETLVRILYDASRVSKRQVLSYDDIAYNIKTDMKLDIKVLDSRKAAKAFAEHMKKYADAYLEVTVTSGRRMIFFFDLKDAASDELLYRYEVTGGVYEQDTERSFMNYAEQFYKHFDRAVADVPRKEAEKAKEAKKAAEKAAKDAEKAAKAATKEAEKAAKKAAKEAAEAQK